MLEDNDPRQNVRNTDPETSHDAAADQNENNVANRMKALRWLFENDRPQGWTDFEIEAAAPDKYFGKCYWKRFSELRATKRQWAMVVDKRTNPATRQPQVASRITKAGREQLGIES